MKLLEKLPCPTMYVQERHFTGFSQYLRFAAFETTDHHVIAMEYLSGGELYDHVLDREGLAEPEARPMFYQIVSAVQHCHLVSEVGRAMHVFTYLAHPPLLELN